MRVLALFLLILPGCMTRAEEDDIANVCFAAERAGAKTARIRRRRRRRPPTFLREHVKTESPAKRALEPLARREGRRPLELSDRGGLGDRGRAVMRTIGCVADPKRSSRARGVRCERAPGR